MYANEYDANTQGFRCVRAARNLHARAYPPMVRAGYVAALVLTAGFGAIVRVL